MPNLRIVSDNAIARASTLTASSTAGSLAAANLLTDIKGDVWRSTSPIATLTATWPAGEPLSCVALPHTNLTQAATMRVRVSNETAATNLIQYPRDLDQNFWGTFGGVSVAPNTVVAPNGIMTADTVTATGLTDCGIFQSQASAVNGTFTGSIWLKSPNPFPINVYITDPLGNNLISAVLTTSWQRFSVTRTVGATTAGTLQIGGAGTFKNGAVIHVWHGQLEAGTVATSAIPELTAFVSRAGANGIKYEFNSVGALTQYAANVAVTAYDPVTLVSRGLSLEATVINTIRNNTMVGAAAGTPGTLSVNWALSLPAGISRTIATGAENGIDYIDLRFFGTASAAGQINLSPESAGTAATSGQTWVNSLFAKVVAGSLTGLAFKITQDQKTSGGSFVTGGPESSVVPSLSVVALRTQRYTTPPATITNGTVGLITPILYSNVANGATIDVTLRIGLPQQEQGYSPTSPIKTTGTAGTRAADISTSPASTRTAGYIDGWQSYSYDSGTVLACPATPVKLHGWAASLTGVNAFGYGGGAAARHWFPEVAGVLGLRVDISDAGNAAGYIEASRLVVGKYWSPVYNADYGATLLPEDASQHVRNDASDLMTSIGTKSRKISISLTAMRAADRSVLMSILRGNGKGAPLFFSLFPQSSDAEQERDYELHCKLSEISAMAIQYYNGYSAPLVLDEV